MPLRSGRKVGSKCPGDVHWHEDASSLSLSIQIRAMTTTGASAVASALELTVLLVDTLLAVKWTGITLSVIDYSNHLQ